MAAPRCGGQGLPPQESQLTPGPLFIFRAMLLVLALWSIGRGFRRAPPHRGTGGTWPPPLPCPRELVRACEASW